jgi:Domain of unknown function (DUF4436)
MHWWVVVLVLAIIFVAVFLFVSNNVLNSEVKEVNQQSCSGKYNPNYVYITATIISVDTDDLAATVRLDFDPHGNLQNQNGQNLFTLTRAMTLTTTGLLAQPLGSSSTVASSGIPSYTSGSSSYVFARGDYMQDLDVMLPLVGGTLGSPSPAGQTTTRYPLDSYANTIPFSFQIRQGSGVGRAYVPSCVQLTSSVGGWSLHANAYDVNNAFDISLSRSAPVKFYSFFVMVLIWALAVGGVAMAVIMWMREQDEIDTGAFAYLAALLFAFPLMRQTLPGNPGPGSLVDVYAFYWTEVIVATTLVVLLGRWITLRGRRRRQLARSTQGEVDGAEGAEGTEGAAEVPTVAVDPRR